MKHARLASWTLLVLATAGIFAACSDDTPPTPIENHCDRKCACDTCTDDERGQCSDDLTNLGDEASNKSCEEQFNAYLTCLNTNGECTDGVYDESNCNPEEAEVNQCINPTPACATVNNQICDEPEGSNTCPEGSDANDCKAPACASTIDGICNEPQPLGDGLCPVDSDVYDCHPCSSRNDGVCDEPATCYAGTDINDCNLGSDCINCNQKSTGVPGTLCTTSAPIFQALSKCACSGFCATACSPSILCGGSATQSGSCLGCVMANCEYQSVVCTLN